MKLSQKIRLLLFERQAGMRRKLLAFFAGRPDIEAASADIPPGFAARRACERELRALLESAPPDVIIVDPREPLCGDMQWISALREFAGVPLIAFAACDVSREAALGSFFDVVRRPLEESDEELSAALRMLAYAVRRAKRPEGAPVSRGELVRAEAGGGIALIGIGASAGGTEAILGILSTLPADMPPILAVQHITPGFAEGFAAHIAKRCARAASVARDGEAALFGRVYLAPDGRHLTVERQGEAFALRCSPGERLSGHLPSIDALFNSLAEQAGERAVGVLLTGMGRDGAAGLRRMRDAGALTIGQDEDSSLIYGMPRAAYELGAVAMQLPLGRIGGELVKHTHKGESRQWVRY